MVSKENHYKITNWSSYNKALKQRGSLEVWIEEGVKETWYYQGKPQRGHSMNILIHVMNWGVSFERYINFHTGKLTRQEDEKVFLQFL